MVIILPDMSLSQNEDKALHIIYKKYLARKSNNINTYQSKVFFINSLQPDLDDSDVMPTLVELSTKRFIKLFSDGHIMINDKAISYIENKSVNSFIKSNDFIT